MSAGLNHKTPFKNIYKDASPKDEFKILELTPRYITAEAVYYSANMNFSDIDKIAKWCGGRIMDREYDIDNNIHVDPILLFRDGNQYALPGDYIVKYLDRFKVMSAEEVTDKYETGTQVRGKHGLGFREKDTTVRSDS